MVQGAAIMGMLGLSALAFATPSAPSGPLSK
jgi:hypothetical protein